MRKLLEVKEVGNIKVGERYGGDTCDGYEIRTEKEVLQLLVENGQNCCESWGFFTSEDRPDDFLGRELVEVEITDTALNTERVEQSGYYEESGGIQFVTLKFSDGSALQFAVYNAHNGYYGHSIYFIVDGKIELDEVL